MIKKIKSAALIVYAITMLSFTLVGATVITEHWLGEPWVTIMKAVVLGLYLLEATGHGPIAKYHEKKVLEKKLKEDII
jgi:hypothetical protein